MAFTPEQLENARIDRLSDEVLEQIARKGVAYTREARLMAQELIARRKADAANKPYEFNPYLGYLPVTHRSAAQKRDRYRSDPAYADVLRERSRAYGQRNPEKRRAYMKGYNQQKKTDAEWLAADRARRKEKQRARREATRADTALHEASLQVRRDKRVGAVREAAVETYLCERVVALSGFCPKFVDPSRRGAPDRLVMVPGLPTVYVELKRPQGGYLERHQKRYHQDIRAAGQQVFVLYSKEQVDQFVALLEVTS